MGRKTCCKAKTGDDKGNNIATSNLQRDKETNVIYEMMRESLRIQQVRLLHQYHSLYGKTSARNARVASEQATTIKQTVILKRNPKYGIIYKREIR